MKPLRPDTFQLTLPDGQKVRCWRKDAEAIRRDVAATGNVCLLLDPATDVYVRIEPGAVQHVPADSVRRIG